MPRLTLAKACVCVVATVSSQRQRAPACEPFCREPCTELHGDVHAECGGCSSRAMACRPGAPFFPDAAHVDQCDLASRVRGDPRSAVRTALAFSVRNASDACFSTDLTTGLCSSSAALQKLFNDADFEVRLASGELVATAFLAGQVKSVDSTYSACLGSVGCVLESPEFSSRWIALSAIGRAFRRGDPLVEQELAKRLDHSLPGVRWTAIKGLAELSTQLQPSTSKMLIQLLGEETSAHPGIGFAALEAIDELQHAIAASHAPLSAQLVTHLTTLIERLGHAEDNQELEMGAWLAVELAHRLRPTLAVHTDTLGPLFALTRHADSRVRLAAGLAMAPYVGLHKRRSCERDEQHEDGAMGCVALGPSHADALPADALHADTLPMDTLPMDAAIERPTASRGAAPGAESEAREACEALLPQEAEHTRATGRALSAEWFLAQMRAYDEPASDTPEWRRYVELPTAAILSVRSHAESLGSDPEGSATAAAMLVRYIVGPREGFELFEASGAGTSWFVIHTVRWRAFYALRHTLPHGAGAIVERALRQLRGREGDVGGRFLTVKALALALQAFPGLANDAVVNALAVGLEESNDAVAFAVGEVLSRLGCWPDSSGEEREARRVRSLVVEAALQVAHGAASAYSRFAAKAAIARLVRRCCSRWVQLDSELLLRGSAPLSAQGREQLRDELLTWSGACGQGSRPAHDFALLARNERDDGVAAPSEQEIAPLLERLRAAPPARRAHAFALYPQLACQNLEDVTRLHERGFVLIRKAVSPATTSTMYEEFRRDKRERSAQGKVQGDSHGALRFEGAVGDVTRLCATSADLCASLGAQLDRFVSAGQLAPGMFSQLRPGIVSSVFIHVNPAYHRRRLDAGREPSLSDQTGWHYDGTQTYPSASQTPQSEPDGVEQKFWVLLHKFPTDADLASSDEASRTNALHWAEWANRSYGQRPLLRDFSNLGVLPRTALQQLVDLLDDEGESDVLRTDGVPPPDPYDLRAYPAVEHEQQPADAWLAHALREWQSSIQNGDGEKALMYERRAQDTLALNHVGCTIVAEPGDAIYLLQGTYHRTMDMGVERVALLVHTQ